ncbi:MAG TPA: sigma-70 family RNA polymerase sigma factor [Solirubrobacteraceae bacterium]|jgi:RNA polymerase sigma factor (sigma-70 family)|nr:sigma-70 family RNA polymerase sigma factor [Solirubrobacteraceae bacterium]
MEVSALKYSGGVGLHGRSPLLRLQSDERLISLLRRGNTTAFEVLFSRYESRLMAFCRHLLGSREDAEDVLQEVMTAAFNAILADDRPINVRPWLYRIARNRSLNHLRRAQAIGVDSMDHHLSENGATTADKVHEREEFRLLVGDIQELPETQKTALVLREMDALSYEQIAEAMETTVPSVKSLLVRARVSLAEAAEARLLSCDQVRIELAEIAEGLQRRPTPLVRRHLRSCKRCSTFRTELKKTNRALAALLPVGPMAMFHKLLFLHLGHSAASGSTATAAAASGAGAAGAGAAGAGAGAAGAGAGAAVAGTAVAGGAAAGSSGLISAGIGALAGKAAAGLAAAALVTAGAVEAGHSTHRHLLHKATVAETPASSAPTQHASVSSSPSSSPSPSARAYAEPRSSAHQKAAAKDAKKKVKVTKAKAKATKTAATDPTTTTTTPTTTDPTTVAAKPPVTGRTQSQSDPTVLPSPPTPVAPAPAASTPPPATATTPTTPTTTPTSTTTTPTTTTTTTTTTPTTTGTTPTGTTTTTPTTTTPPQSQTPPQSSTTPSSTDSNPHTLAFFRSHAHRWWGRDALAFARR